jgi:hypothetical protein
MSHVFYICWPEVCQFYARATLPLIQVRAPEYQTFVLVPDVDGRTEFSLPPYTGSSTTEYLELFKNIC